VKYHYRKKKQKTKNKKLIAYIEGKYAIFTKSNTDSRFEVLTLVTTKINTFWDMGHLVW